jgi:hypothetical protein
LSEKSIVPVRRGDSGDGSLKLHRQGRKGREGKEQPHRQERQGRQEINNLNSRAPRNCAKVGTGNVVGAPVPETATANTVRILPVIVPRCCLYTTFGAVPSRPSGFDPVLIIVLFAVKLFSSFADWRPWR